MENVASDTPGTPPHTVALNVEWVTPNLETPPSIDPHCFLLNWPVSLKVHRHLILLPPRTEELLPYSSGPAIHRISAPLLLPKLDQIIISLLLPLAPSKHLSSLFLCGIIPGLVKVFIKDRKRSCHFFLNLYFVLCEELIAKDFWQSVPRKALC